MPLSTRARIGLCASAAAIVVIAVLVTVPLDPSSHVVYLSAAVIGGSEATSGSTTCGTGSWHISAASQSKVLLYWAVNSYSANYSNPGQSSATLWLEIGSTVADKVTGTGGNISLVPSSGAGITAGYSLCTDSYVSTLVVYGTVTSSVPLL